MSEESDADDISEIDEQTDPINRRRFVKSLGVAGGAAVFGTTGIGNVTATETDQSVPESNLNVKDANEIGEETVSEHIDAALSVEHNQALKQNLETEYNLKPSLSDTLGFDVQTDDDRWNSYEPSLLMTPFGPKTDREQDRYAFLNVLTVEHEGELKPAASYAIVATPGKTETASPATTSPDGLSGQPTNDFTMTLVGTNEQGESEKINETIYSEPVGLRPQVSIGCTTCGAIAGKICERGGAAVGARACVRICLPLVTTVVGYLGCSAACTLIIRGVAFVGCAYGGAKICQSTPLC